MYKNNNELIAAFNAGTKLKYIFFWGHSKSTDESVTKSCFSQWFPAPFEIDGIRYETTEHYMMAEKARCFGDMEMEEKIISTVHPKQAKAFGRAVKNFDPKVWNEEGFRAVVRGNIAKFQQNEEMGDFLLDTNSRIIVEASPRDRIWGIGMGQSNPQVENPNFWKGKNLLGYALMETRQALRLDLEKQTL